LRRPPARDSVWWDSCRMRRKTTLWVIVSWVWTHTTWCNAIGAMDNRVWFLSPHCKTAEIPTPPFQFAYVRWLLSLHVRSQYTCIASS
jgi:hypothetical protein